MPNFWDKLVVGFPKTATILSYVELPDSTAPLPVIKEGEHYFRIWLAQMHLVTAQQWFVNQHPAVNARITVKFGGNEKMAFGKVIAPSQDSFSEGVFSNYPLTELLPYRGGIVELTAGLLALPGDNGWRTAAKLLEKFSDLVVPPVGQMMAVAQQVSSAVGDFLGQLDVNPHLGLHQSFTSSGGGGGNGFGPGYIAVVLAPSGTFKPGSLLVKDKALHVQKGGGSIPLATHDFMLFRIEGRASRDDVLLRNIEEPYREALSAIAYGESKKADACERAAIAAALLSPDLTWPDQRLVVETVKSRLAEARGKGWGAIASPGAQVSEMQAVRMQIKATPLTAVAARGPMSFDEAFAN